MLSFPRLPLGGFHDCHLAGEHSDRPSDQGGADPYGSAGLTAPHRRAIFREIRFSFFWGGGPVVGKKSSKC